MRISCDPMEPSDFPYSLRNHPWKRTVHAQQYCPWGLQCTITENHLWDWVCSNLYNKRTFLPSHPFWVSTLCWLTIPGGSGGARKYSFGEGGGGGGGGHSISILHIYLELTISVLHICLELTITLTSSSPTVRIITFLMVDHGSSLDSCKQLFFLFVKRILNLITKNVSGRIRTKYIGRERKWLLPLDQLPVSAGT